MGQFKQGEQVVLKKNYKQVNEYKALSKNVKEDIDTQKGYALTVRYEVERRVGYESKRAGVFTIPVELLISVELKADANPEKEKKEKGEKEMYKLEDYKVGGQVLVMETNQLKSFYNKGDICVIKELDGYTPENNGCATLVTACGHTQDARLKHLCPIDMDRKIQVGDTVYVLKTNCEDDDYHKGDICTVLESGSEKYALVREQGGGHHASRKTHLCIISPPAKKEKRKYTSGQISQAKAIATQIMFTPVGCSAILLRRYINAGAYDSKDSENKGTPRTIAILFGLAPFLTYAEEKRAVAVCCEDDEWNEDVGNMVALCKLMDRDMPAWVHGATK